MTMSWNINMYNTINPDDVLVRAEVGSCDIFDLLTSEIEIHQAVHQPPPPPRPEPQPMKHQEAAIASERGKSLGSAQTKCIPSTRRHLHGGGDQKKHSAHETHRIAQKRRRDKIKMKIKALQELLPVCTKSDTASVINEAIKHIQFLKNQAEWLKLQFIPMAPAFTSTPTLFYPTMLPSSQFQMVCPPLPPQLPPQLAGGSSTAVLGGASYQREDGTESQKAVDRSRLIYH